MDNRMDYCTDGLLPAPTVARSLTHRSSAGSHLEQREPFHNEVFSQAGRQFIDLSGMVVAQGYPIDKTGRLPQETYSHVFINCKFLAGSALDRGF
jgi:hypothetical protein